MRHADSSAENNGNISAQEMSHILNNSERKTLQHPCHATTASTTNHEASILEAPTNESGLMSLDGSSEDGNYCGDRGKDAITNSSESSNSTDLLGMNLVCNFYCLVEVIKSF